MSVMVFGALGVAGAVVACSAFDAAEGSGGTDAAPETATGDAATGDGADPSEGTCVPAPLDPVDAGEDASCPGSALTTDLLTAGQHCGRCGHSCQGDGCTNGMCNVKDVTSGEGAPPLLGSVANGYLYYATNGSSPTLRRYPLGGGTPETLALLVGGSVLDARADGTDLYAIHSTMGVITVPIEGRVASTVVARAPNTVYRLTIDDKNLYWVTYTNVETKERSAGDGGTNVQIHADPTTEEITALVADDTRVYWAALAYPPASTTRLFTRLRGANASSEVRADNLARVSALATDSKYVYWATADGEVWRAAKADGSAPQQVMRVTGASRYPKGLAVDATDVYVGVSASQNIGDVDLTIFSAPKCGGPPRRLAVNQIVGSPMLMAGGYLYWGHATSIRRVVK